MSKFGLGDWVWYATTERLEERLVCPDCAGTRFLTVIMGDGTAEIWVDADGTEYEYTPDWDEEARDE